MAVWPTKLLDELVGLVADDNEFGIPASQLIDDCVHLGQRSVCCGNHYDGQVFVNQSQGAVLQLSSHDALTVHQSNLFYLQAEVRFSSLWKFLEPGHHEVPASTATSIWTSMSNT